MRRLPPYLLDLCRQMRRSPTDPEAWMWSCVRARRLGGAKFRRQRPLGRYIADFCCDELRLVVELDGAIHGTQLDYDAARDAYLTAAGYLTLRLANDEVMDEPEAALGGLMAAVREASEGNLRAGSPSPLEGEGAGR